MKKAFAIALAMTAALFSCGKPAEDNEENITPIERREIALTRAQFDLVGSGNALAADMMQKITAQNSGSFIFSPLSLEYALAMVDNGAAGKTEEQIRKVIGFGDYSVKEINESYKALTSGLLKVDNTVKINIANAQIFNTAIGGGGEMYKDAYKNALKTNYNALFEGYDFNKDNKNALNEINGWASRQTAGMIDPLLDELDPSTASLLMNAIYFKGTWTEQFEARNTRKETFTKADGSKVEVDMMNQTSNVYYRKMKGCKVMGKPYGNGAFLMTFILPDEGTSTAEFAKNIDKTFWEDATALYGTPEVIIKLPKFETSSEIDLKDMLISLGMTDAFTGNADFSNMSDIPLYISRIFQKARIKVEEKGTEAAAVTVVDIKVTSAMPEHSDPLTFYANRPFLYAISEISTGAILFMGQYNGK